MLLTLVFWFLDSYFLWQERLFRALYDHVRTLKEDQIDIAHEPDSFRGPAEVVRSSILDDALAAMAQIFFIVSLT